jgi:hypothetical protein
MNDTQNQDIQVQLVKAREQGAIGGLIAGISIGLAIGIIFFMSKQKSPLDF